MIRYIKGTYTMQFDTGIVVETGSGVGFEIFVHQGSPIYKHSEGDEIQVFTEMVVREDGMSLYGFHNRETLEFFKMLTAVSGIGPKGAMGILGSMPLTELKLADGAIGATWVTNDGAYRNEEILTDEVLDFCKDNVQKIIDGEIVLELPDESTYNFNIAQ